MAVHEQAIELDAQKRRDLWTRYVELLGGEQSDPADAAALQQVMESLARSPTELQRDAAVLKSAHIVQDRIVAAKGVADRESAADVALASFKQETEQIGRERTRKFKDLERDLAARREEHSAATLDLENFNAMKDKNPELLRHLKPVTRADLA